MAVSLSSLRITAEFDAAPYVRGANQKAGADDNGRERQAGCRVARSDRTPARGNGIIIPGPPTTVGPISRGEYPKSADCLISSARSGVGPSVRARSARPNGSIAPIPAVRQYREICRVRTPKLSFKFSSAMAHDDPHGKPSVLRSIRV